MEQVGRTTLASSPRDLLRLCQSSQTMRTKLEVLRLLAERKRASWVPELTAKQIDISNEGRTLTVVSHDDSIEPWVSGRLLPTVGKSAWKVRVDRSRENDGNGIWVGVCDAEATCSW